MKSYAELCKLTEAGDVQLIHAVGVPRSMSTALCRALNEAGVESLYINEPFNRANNDTEQASKSIMDVIYEQEKRGSQARLVIVKNMASYLNDDSFGSFDNIAARSIWNIRHPLRQLESLVTRLANDLLIYPGASSLSMDDVYQHIGMVCDYLEDSPKSTNFSKTGWKSIDRLFSLKNNNQYSVIDGELFSVRPHQVLGQLCSELAIPFSERMVDNWSEGFINVVNKDDISETENSAWTNVAYASKGVMNAQRQGLDIDRVPRSLSDHLVQIALPVYEELSSFSKSSAS